MRGGGGACAVFVHSSRRAFTASQSRSLEIMLASLSATTSFATFLPPFGTPRAADFAVEVSPDESVEFPVVDERPGLVLGRGAPPQQGCTNGPPPRYDPFAGEDF